jgi:hypothetical protein
MDRHPSWCVVGGGAPLPYVLLLSNHSPPLPPPPPSLPDTGIFGIFLIITSWVYIARIDSVPRIDACGCSWHTKSRYAPAVTAPSGGLHGHGHVEDSVAVTLRVQPSGPRAKPYY